MKPETVLVVDDEPMVLSVVKRVLMRQGYRVLCSASPQEAVEIVLREPAIDVVLSDVVMPQMRGPELIQAIARLSPSTAAVLMSGDVGAKTLPASVPFIEKPLHVAHLVATIEQALASRASRPLPPGREQRDADDITEAGRERTG